MDLCQYQKPAVIPADARQLDGVLGRHRTYGLGASILAYFLYCVRCRPVGCRDGCHREVWLELGETNGAGLKIRGA